MSEFEYRPYDRTHFSRCLLIDSSNLPAMPPSKTKQRIVEGEVHPPKILYPCPMPQHLL